MPGPIVHASQIELPVSAENDKSPIRKLEFDFHVTSAKHVPLQGLPGQICVMTSQGPRMMFPKVNCDACSSDGQYGLCDCHVVLDDTPSGVAADVKIRCLKNGVTEVINGGTSINIPNWTLVYDSDSTFFRFIPDKVFDCDLSQLSWVIVDNAAMTLTGTPRLVDGKMVFDVYFDMQGPDNHNDYIVTGASPQFTEMMRITIKKKTTLNIRQIACGLSSTYFLEEGGIVWSCGDNVYGQLGRNVPSGTPTEMNLGKIPGLPSDIVQVAATHSSAFFLQSNGDVWCCGDNSEGQLGVVRAQGYPSMLNLAKNTAVSGVKSISCGKDFVYFLKTDGTILNAGNNDKGQLGRIAGAGAPTVSNLGILNLPGVSMIACGDAFVYFIVNEEDLWNCGSNLWMPLGRISSSGTAGIPNLAKACTFSEGITTISCGSIHGVVLLSDGRTFFAGSNAAGAFGIGYGGSTDIFVGGLVDGYTHVAAGNNFTYFIKSGTVWNCGANAYGQLGKLGSGSDMYPNLSSIGEGTRVAVRDASAYWILPDGNVMAAGNNANGQLGFVAPAAMFWGLVDF